MDILIVEDSKPDRDFLKYLLEERFQKDASFREADRLEIAVKYLKSRTFDCVILDLSLPDSSGRETFEKLYQQFPEVPFVIMTNTKDRALALELVKHGAADYIIKGVNTDELFDRISFAAAKHKISIRVPPADVATIQRLEKTRVAMDLAHKSGEFHAVQETTIATTNAIADLAQRVFTELQTISKNQTRDSINLETMSGIVKDLEREVLRGTGDRPSMRSSVDIVLNDMSSIRVRVKDLEEGDRQAMEDVMKAAELKAQRTQDELVKKQQDMVSLQETVLAKQLEEKVSTKKDRLSLLASAMTVVATIIAAYLAYLAAIHK